MPLLGLFGFIRFDVFSQLGNLDLKTPRLTISLGKNFAPVKFGASFNFLVRLARGTFLWQQRKVPKRKLPEDSLFLRFSSLALRSPDSAFTLCYPASRKSPGKPSVASR